MMQSYNKGTFNCLRRSGVQFPRSMSQETLSQCNGSLHYKTLSAKSLSAVVTVRDKQI